MNNIFEKATRLKLRFSSSAGCLSVEDLWDLPLSGRCVNLDDIARGLHAKLKDHVESFVHKEKRPDEIVDLKFEIVKHVIDARLAEAEEAEKTEERRQKKHRILDLLAQKEDEKLMESSADDLRKLLDDL